MPSPVMAPAPPRVADRQRSFPHLQAYLVFTFELAAVGKWQPFMETTAHGDAKFGAAHAPHHDLRLCRIALGVTIRYYAQLRGYAFGWFASVRASGSLPYPSQLNRLAIECRKREAGKEVVGC